jgi:hypothetical protein
MLSAPGNRDGKRMTMKPFFQAGIVVPDLERAMQELTDALDVHWAKPVERQFEGSPLRMVFSLDGPPYLELVEGPPGSPWEATDGPRLDHLGYWSEDLVADRDRLAAGGFGVEAYVPPAGGVGYGYFRAPATGLRIELIDSSVRAESFGRWGVPDPDAS